MRDNIIVKKFYDDYTFYFLAGQKKKKATSDSYFLLAKTEYLPLYTFFTTIYFPYTHTRSSQPLKQITSTLIWLDIQPEINLIFYSSLWLASNVCIWI